VSVEEGTHARHLVVEISALGRSEPLKRLDRNVKPATGTPLVPDSSDESIDEEHRVVARLVFCQGPYDESSRYRDFMGWDMPWYSAQDSLGVLLAPPKRAGMMHLVCYLRSDDRVFQTYWTTLRGVEAMDYSYTLMDLTVYGRQEAWEDSPSGWPRGGHLTRTDGGAPDWPRVSVWPGGRPTAQWPRLAAGRSDGLGAMGG
jgi:hypothetical protein